MYRRKGKVIATDINVTAPALYIADKYYIVPNKETATICFDKFMMFKYLQEQKINTVLTYGDIENQPCFGNYDNDIVMMMYDSVVIEKITGL